MSLFVLVIESVLMILRVVFWRACHPVESLSLGSNERLTLLP